MSSPPRFLLDGCLDQPGDYVLNRVESHHGVNVVRLRRGDVVVVFDGAGRYADAVVQDADKNGMRVSVERIAEEPRRAFELVIATAIPKGKRWQLLVEKCTELGADSLKPMLTQRSVVRGEGDPEKWRRWIVEAAKQCRRARIPDIDEPAMFPDVLAAARIEGAVMYADPEGESPASYRELLAETKRLTVMIGPEGGFADDEEDLLRVAGAKPLRLGSFTLRVETAAGAACAMIREVL